MYVYCELLYREPSIVLMYVWCDVSLVILLNINHVINLYKHLSWKSYKAVSCSLCVQWCNGWKVLFCCCQVVSRYLTQNATTAHSIFLLCYISTVSNSCYTHTQVGRYLHKHVYIHMYVYICVCRYIITSTLCIYDVL